MSDTLASRPVYLSTYTERIVARLIASPRDMSLLRQRLATVGKREGYAMTIAEIEPGLPATYYGDITESVSRALKAKVQGRIRRARRIA